MQYHADITLIHKVIFLSLSFHLFVAVAVI